MKKIKLKRFFRSFFPINSYLFCLFENLDTGAYEVVSRSGYVLLTVPRLPCLTDEEHKKLFLEVVFCFALMSFNVVFIEQGGDWHMTLPLLFFMPDGSLWNSISFFLS